MLQQACAVLPIVQRLQDSSQEALGLMRWRPFSTASSRGCGAGQMHWATHM